MARVAALFIWHNLLHRKCKVYCRLLHYIYKATLFRDLIFTCDAKGKCALSLLPALFSLCLLPILHLLHLSKCLYVYCQTLNI